MSQNVDINFNSPWELDGVRTISIRLPVKKEDANFNSPWELDGVRTCVFLQDKTSLYLISIPPGN